MQDTKKFTHKVKIKLGGNTITIQCEYLGRTLPNRGYAEGYIPSGYATNIIKFDYSDILEWELLNPDDI
jgi:hypothetical protein